MGVQKESLDRHVVADEADDDGVPHRGGGAWKRIQEMASHVGLTLLTQFAQARPNADTVAWA